MKFGKEFTAQMVPEWQEAYMDYNQLKTILKEIQRFKQRNWPAATPRGLKRKQTLYRAFSGLTQRQHHSASPSERDIENQPIMVNSVHKNGSESYETTFLMASDEGGEYELVYFRRIDDEFNKVEKFYRSKVEEVRKEANTLNKQMDAFIAFRIKVENPTLLGFDRSVEITRLASDVAASTAALSASTPRGAKFNRSVSTVIEAIDEESTHHGEQSSDSKHEEKQTSNQQVQEQKPKNRVRPAHLEILNRVHISNTLETPRSTIKGFLNHQDQTGINFSRKNLNKVEQQLKLAFIEFYQKLRLLKSYSFLNTLAFFKIMKKYDKITSRGAAKAYMRMVDNSYFGSNEEVAKLIERVEKSYIKHFSNSNRSKGMSILRPNAKKERHRITFSMGFLAGCTIALLVALILIIRTRKIDKHEGATKYMETLFPLYSLFGFIVLHILMYAANIYFWRRYRVNYSFIFGFKKGKELGYKEVLLLGFGIAALALSSVLANLDMQIDPKTRDYKALTELLPLILLLSLIVILLCPFNVIYCSNRVFFLTCLFHCICAPFYKVTLPDFFLADQFTSQVQALRSFEFYICYYGSGDFKHRKSTCKDDTIFKTFAFIIAAIPYWSRFLQSLRRLYEEKDPMQGYNGLKYFITIVAVCLRTAHNLDGGKGWQVLAWIFSIAAAIFSTYWDLVIDWGLLRRHSKNRWLRDKLIIPQKSVYFVAMVLNVLLRFAWLQTILNFKFSFFHRQAMISLFSSLEIIRRGIWNFFRLENEHLNNVGKYRAFKSVPLPFNYDEDEDTDE